MLAQALPQPQLESVRHQPAMSQQQSAAPGWLREKCTLLPQRLLPSLLPPSLLPPSLLHQSLLLPSDHHRSLQPNQTPSGGGDAEHHPNVCVSREGVSNLHFCFGSDRSLAAGCERWGGSQTILFS